MQSTATRCSVDKGWHACGRRKLVCNASKSGDGGPWPWSRKNSKATPPPPPPPPPPQPGAPSSIQEDLLRTSPKWRKWPIGVSLPPESAAGSQQQRQVQPQQSAWGTTTQRQQKRQAQQQFSPEQQHALQDMLQDFSVNPKWRWPTFSSGQGLEQQQQRQQQQPPPPPPPPPQQRWWQQGAGQEYRQQQQQQYSQQEQQYQEQQRFLADQQQRLQQWQWPFVGGGFQPTPEDEFREKLEAMGVDLQGSKARERARQQQQQREQDMLGSFEQLDDREVARYMSQLRKNRLERVQNRQDDEVVGIAGLYLAVTLLVLLMAALANLPV